MSRRVKVLYDYEAQDLDEITIKEGQLVDLLKEGGALLGCGLAQMLGLQWHSLHFLPR